MLSFQQKRSLNGSCETPAQYSIQHNQSQEVVKNQSYQRSKIKSEMSILEKLQASKHKNIQDINISSKLKINQGNNINDVASLYFVASQNPVNESFKSKSNNNPYKYQVEQDKLATFSPMLLKNNRLTESSITLKHSKNDVKTNKENQLSKTPLRHQRFLNHTESWAHKITLQKSTKKQYKAQFSMRRRPLASISIHQQLYLQSRKKQIKRSTQQIIQHQYFKKVHPFRPQISEVSEFLAEQKRQKIKERQRFEREFEDFEDWKEQRKFTNSKLTKIDRKHKDQMDIQNQKQTQQKQAELKNYTVLKQFFSYLSQNCPSLRYAHLAPKKLYELPSPCIQLLEPILEDFYKNKKIKNLSWLQFLSEFNLKVQNKKSFYGLIEKWFWLKFGLKFNINCKEKFCNQDEISDDKKHEDSTYIGHSVFQQQDNTIRVNKINNFY